MDPLAYATAALAMGTFFLVYYTRRLSKDSEKTQGKLVEATSTLARQVEATAMSALKARLHAETQGYLQQMVVFFLQHPDLYNYYPDILGKDPVEKQRALVLDYHLNMFSRAWRNHQVLEKLGLSDEDKSEFKGWNAFVMDYVDRHSETLRIALDNEWWRSMYSIDFWKYLVTRNADLRSVLSRIEPALAAG